MLGCTSSSALKRLSYFVSVVGLLFLDLNCSPSNKATTSDALSPDPWDTSKCTFTGHAHNVEPAGFYDPNLPRKTFKFVSYVKDTAGNVQETLTLFNYPDREGSLLPGETKTISIDKQNLNKQTCATCVLGSRVNSRGTMANFFAKGGELTATLPVEYLDGYWQRISNNNNKVNLNFQRLILHELDKYGNFLADGDHWCIDNKIYTNTSAKPWLCKDEYFANIFTDPVLLNNPPFVYCGNNYAFLCLCPLKNDPRKGIVGKYHDHNTNTLTYEYVYVDSAGNRQGDSNLPTPREYIYEECWLKTLIERTDLSAVCY